MSQPTPETDAHIYSFNGESDDFVRLSDYDALKHDYNALRTFCAKQAAELDEQEIERLRDDAERYRWLRTSERFTAVIDAARKEQSDE